MPEILTKEREHKIFQLVETIDNLYLALYGNVYETSWRVTPELAAAFDAYKNASNLSKSEILKEVIEETDIHRPLHNTIEFAFELAEKNISEKIVEKYFVLLCRMREYFSQGKWYEFFWNNYHGQGELMVVADNVEEAISYAESLSPCWKLHRHIENTTISVSSWEFPHVTKNTREQQIDLCRKMKINIDELY